MDIDNRYMSEDEDSFFECPWCDEKIGIKVDEIVASVSSGYRITCISCGEKCDVSYICEKREGKTREIIMEKFNG